MLPLRSGRNKDFLSGATGNMQLRQESSYEDVGCFVSSNTDTTITSSNITETDKAHLTPLNDKIMKSESALQPDVGMEADFRVENNPFAFAPGQLNKMFKSKSLPAFYALSGLDGIENGMRTNRMVGLSVNKASLYGQDTFEEDTTKKDVPASASASDADASGGEASQDRLRVFIDNQLPPKKGKSLLELMWVKYNDKVLIMLSVATVVSLAVGLYQKITCQHEPDNSHVEGVETVAIIAAITTVVIVRALNDYPKESHIPISKFSSMMNAPVRNWLTKPMDQNWAPNEAVQTLREDQIRAQAITEECGILQPNNIVMEGPKSSNLSKPRLEGIISRLHSLRRSSPEDKRILVRRLKDIGDIIPVTNSGDKVPALEKSHCLYYGVGTRILVAKEASFIDLREDDFTSIIKVLQLGQAVNDAVRQFIQARPTANMLAVRVVLTPTIPSCLQSSIWTVAWFFWVNLIMDTLAALALVTDTVRLTQTGLRRLSGCKSSTGGSRIKKVASLDSLMVAFGGLHKPSPG